METESQTDTLHVARAVTDVGGLDATTRQALADDDRLAWKNVCGELIAIVSGGLVLGILAVVLCILYLSS
jgi:hypothetical protein